MEQWKDAASQQLKLLSRRLNEELSRGLGWLRSELGVDLGLKPELIPPWALVLAACAGLLVVVAVWASVCRAVFGKRPAVRPVNEGTGIEQTVSKPVKADEPKKKKKKAEKKAQPNGRAVPEPQEEAVASEETVPHHQPPPPPGKSEKSAEGKKSKKKQKPASKETKIVTADSKEPEEGTWETKVSNKEKREQRKKDKSSSDGSSSPGGGSTPMSAPPEPPKTPSAGIPAPANQKKKESARVKAEKVESAVTQANSSEAVDAAAAKGSLKVKGPSHNVPSKQGSWTTSIQPAPLWRSGIDDSWTVIDRPVPSAELNLVSLGRLGVGPAQAQSVSNLSWVSQPRVEDEWSGINGASADPSSDWNAPSEAWGNYEEPSAEAAVAQEKPFPELSKFIQIGAADEDEDEKDKGEGTNDGAAKTKKKKKKKKKASEEGGPSGQAEEPMKEAIPAVSVKKQPPAQETTAAVQPVKAAAVERGERSVKDVPPPVTQVPQKSAEGEPTAKQNNLPTPAAQKKSEESPAPKPAKKKKARRET